MHTDPEVRTLRGLVGFPMGFSFPSGHESR